VLLGPRAGGPLAADDVRHLRVTIRVPRAEAEAAQEQTPGKVHHVVWTVTLPVQVSNLADTVTDELQLTVELAPFVRAAHGWEPAPDARYKDPGYAWVTRRTYRPLPEAVTHLPSRQPAQSARKVHRVGLPAKSASLIATTRSGRTA
jgi:hypothetical protein